MATSGHAYPPVVDDEEKERLVLIAKDWAVAHGLTIRPPPALVDASSDPAAILASHAPVTLFPSPFPRICFEQGLAAQKGFNELYAKVSVDEKFIEDTVKEVIDGDDFIASLWGVHQKVKEEGYVQPLSLGLFRSDYMVHKDASDPSAKPEIKQVEFNTIAASFGGLSTQTSDLHRFLSKTEYPLLKGFTGDELDLPPNESTKGLASGLVAAHKAYGTSALGHQTCIIFLCQDGERNIFDQRHLEYAVKDLSPAVPVFRLPFSKILERTSVEASQGRQLLYRPPSNPSSIYEVSLVYFRSGYGPGDYPQPSDWDARLHLERSAAIKCPTVLTQLAGTKKVQQILATPTQVKSESQLSRFISESSPAFDDVWQTFTNIYPMDTSGAGLAARKLAQDPEECQKYVLKPQREGGGNNTYRAAIPPFLKSVPEAHWGSYILMELITPPPLTNTILRNGKIEEGGVICELGIYGACLWNNDSGEIIHNEQQGYLLRTKGDKSEEGGVAAGYGCMDSVALV